MSRFIFILFLIPLLSNAQQSLTLQDAYNLVNKNYPIAKQVGLLQQKWGRSVVGGCLFVVLKDAITLYCKWRRAKNQGKRKVLDYVKGGKTKGGL